MKKKKLLIATDNFIPRRDGVVRFLTEIIPRIKKEFEITILCPDDDMLKKTYEGVKLEKISLSKRSVGDFRVPKFKPLKIFNQVKKHDIIFTQTIGPIGVTTLFLAQKLLKKNVSYIHSIEWELAPKSQKNKLMKRITYHLANSLAKYLYSKNTLLIMPSENISEYFVYKKIMTPRKIIHLGVDSTKFKPVSEEEKNQKRTSLGINKEEIVIGYHGRIAREKDIKTLIRSFVKIRKKHANTRLLIIGDGIKEIIRSLRKQPGVIYLQAKENVEDYLPIMDIYCLPSQTETTSLSVLEAMSCKLPVIATPVGFVRDYIKSGKTGLFFKTGDSYDLAKKITFLINNPKIRNQIGEEAKKLVTKQFIWEETAEKIIETLNKLGENINEEKGEFDETKTDKIS